MPTQKLFVIEQCAGNKGCPNGVVDTSNIIDKINEIAEKENFADFIKQKIKGPIRQHNTFRVGIANCPNACSQVHIKDFGIIGKVKVNFNPDKCNLCGQCLKVCFERALSIQNKKLHFNSVKCIGCGMCVKTCENSCFNISSEGFQIMVGGKLGRHPMLAIEIENFADEQTVFELFLKTIKFYKQHNLFGERLGTIFQRMKINSNNIKKFYD